MKNNPTDWFDQFGCDNSGWEHPQWCARHWAPCPILGANGMGATIELMQIFMNEMVGPNEHYSPEQLNAKMDEAGRICCVLGDERMYEIWGRWPPTGGVEISNNHHG